MTSAKGVAVLRGEGATAEIHGIIRLHQPHGGLDAQVRVQGRITGLVPGTKHGLRICLFGDESEGGFRGLGGIYNPYSKQHGDRDDEDRPVGALGNIEAGDDGIALFDFTDPVLKLIGPLSVFGRMIAITEGEDNGGKGESAESAIDGHAGPVIACGVIGIAAIGLMG